MLTATVDMSVFNAGMRGLITKCRISAPVVIRKEAGELIKELILRSPPKSPKKTRDSIESGIKSKFASIADSQNSDTSWMSGGWKVGPSGIRWYYVDSNFLHGVAPQRDMRKASVADLARLRFQITKSGKRLNVPIKGHEKQRALIYQTILTKRGTVTKLISKIKENVGRLKAGWLVAVNRGQVSISGAKMPPQWVTKHSAGARGDTINNLSVPNKPSFTIINYAKGITQKGMDLIVQLAVKSRAASMATNTRLILAGKKRLADYA